MVSKNFILIQTTSFASIYINEMADVILIKYNEGCVINLDIAKEANETALKLIKKYKVKLFISDNTAKYLTSTIEARKFLSNNNSLKQMKAHAIITKELPVRLLVNSFIKFSKPIIPFKSFNTIDKALKWLYSF